MKTKKLKQQIKELTEDATFEDMAQKKLKGFDILAIIHRWGSGDTFRIVVELSDCPLKDVAEKIQQILKAYPATKNNKFEYGDKKIVCASPFLLKWDNGINRHKAGVEYQSGKVELDIELPVNFYSDDVKGVFMRGVTDCEYHYFGGVSMSEIRQMKLRCYKLDMFESAKYFGGSVTNYITDKEDKEEFESVVLFGHVPEFKEFHQKQLKQA